MKQEYPEESNTTNSFPQGYFLYTKEQQNAQKSKKIHRKETTS
jgi:hypothetical protein